MGCIYHESTTVVTSFLVKGLGVVVFDAFAAAFADCVSKRHEVRLWSGTASIFVILVAEVLGTKCFGTSSYSKVSFVAVGRECEKCETHFLPILVPGIVPSWITFTTSCLCRL
jgi:hypothetical protein